MMTIERDSRGSNLKNKNKEEKMTRLLNKRQAIYYRTKIRENDIALARLYQMKKGGRIQREEFTDLLPSVRAGRLFWKKRLTGKR